MCLFFVEYILLTKRMTHVFDRSPTVALLHDILDDKKFGVEKLTENIERVYYCNKFDPFKCLV